MKKRTLLILIVVLLLNGVAFAQNGVEHLYFANENSTLNLKLANILSNTYINILLITIGFIGLIIEILSPGFGVGGIISIISFGLFFAGNIISGNSQWTSLIIFVVGLILLIIEAIAPGFGLPGISGIILILAGIILAMDSVQSAILSLSISIILTAIITALLIKRGRNIEAFKKIVLSTKQKDEEGYLSSSTKSEYLGKEGVALSDLRPSGVIQVDEEKLDALSEGNFIPKGSGIKIIRVEGPKIIVRRL